VAKDKFNDNRKYIIRRMTSVSS